MVSVLASSAVNQGYYNIGSKNYIGGVMVSVLASSAVNQGYYNIGIYCFSSKHAALRRKSKDWLARNQNRVGQHVNLRTIFSVN